MVRGHEITVVFDGHSGYSARNTVSREGDIEIIFSRIASKADDVIKAKVERDKRYYIVVSSDREIADFAWSHGSVPVSSEDFADRLERALGKGISEEQDEVIDEFMEKMLLDEYDVEERAQRKGSSRRLSKRQKAIVRALEKL
jgi:predicted RNA-binding protein with PIN domain